MTQISTETLALTDGTHLRLSIAEPDNVVRGGIVVLHEGRGVTDRIQELISAIAEEGWLTVAPHLYHRRGTGTAEEVAGEMQGLSGESVLADTDAAFVWLSDHGVASDLQGIVGFGTGGSAAVMVAANRRLGAAVSVGGEGILVPLSDALPALVDVAGELASPWLGLYDRAVAGEEVDKLRDAAHGAEVATDVVHHSGADHRFDTDADTALDAWRRARNWFDLHLR